MKSNLRGSPCGGRMSYLMAAKRGLLSKPTAVVVDFPNEPNWLELPREIVLTIFLKVNQVELLTRVQAVCSLWRSISMDPFLWRTIKMSRNPYNVGLDYHMLCRRAVDYSRGQLVDISLGSFGNDDLLSYIADSALHLRSLRLVSCCLVSCCCSGLSNGGLRKAVEKLSELEEVDISICNISENCIEAKLS